MMEENKEYNVYTELVCKAFKYFEDHPVMLLGVGLSAGISVVSTCAIMTTCLIVDKKSKGVC